MASEFAAAVAPVVDELVFSVLRTARSAFGSELRERLGAAGVTRRGIFADLADVILADELTERTIGLRHRYAQDEASRMLQELVGAGHLSHSADRLIASETVKSLLFLSETRLGDAAAMLWSDAEAVEAAAPIPKVLAAAAIDDGLLSADLVAPEHDRATHRLFQRLTRLRYLRNDAHAAAWAAKGLEAGEIVALSQAWRGSEVADASAADRLRSRGWLDEDDRLTDEGRVLRVEIEDETNRLCGVAFAVLDPATRSGWRRLLAALATAS